MGGGGVAFDCAITAKRLGADEVRIVCLEGEDCMVAPPDDLAEAKRQGITVHNRCMASSVLASGGRAGGLECFEISGFSFDAAGEARIETKSDQKKTFSADTVIFAVGVKPELSFLEGTGIGLNPNGAIAVDAETHATSLRGVFAAGDVATGASIAARAVGQGREAAMAVNRFLLGHPKEEQVLTIGNDLQIRSEQIGCAGEAHVVAFSEILNPEYYEKTGRDKRPDIEAGRCFHCGHCSKCGKCVEDCPGLILAMTESGPGVRYADECWHCGNCRISCPDSAVSYEFPLYTLV
jgi:heterodisulfide reductase subunit A-like polyferredoxin